MHQRSKVATRYGPAFMVGVIAGTVGGGHQIALSKTGQGGGLSGFLLKDDARAWRRPR